MSMLMNAKSFVDNALELKSKALIKLRIIIYIHTTECTICYLLFNFLIFVVFNILALWSSAFFKFQNVLENFFFWFHTFTQAIMDYSFISLLYMNCCAILGKLVKCFLLFSSSKELSLPYDLDDGEEIDSIFFC